MTGGAELTHSADGQGGARNPGRGHGDRRPYAETVEQLTGFYLVETDDLDDLLNLCGLLSEGDPIEVRACLPEAAR